MADGPGRRGRPQRTERRRCPTDETRPTRSGRPRRGPWGRWAETRNGPRMGETADAKGRSDHCNRGLTKKRSAAGQTDDGLEPGEQCKPAHTAGPLQRLVRPHAESVEDGSALTESEVEHEPRRPPQRMEPRRRPLDPTCWSRSSYREQARRGPWGRRAETDDGPRMSETARVRSSTSRLRCGLTKKCSAAGQTDDGLEPGEQCKPAHTAGPLQRLVRPHAEDERGC